MNTTSQLTKDIHSPTYLRKLIRNNGVATRHIISTHEECPPQYSFSLQLSIIHSFKCKCVCTCEQCVCTCEHTLDINIISYLLTSIHPLYLHSSIHIPYMLHILNMLHFDITSQTCYSTSQNTRQDSSSILIHFIYSTLKTTFTNTY